jgi:ribosomal protein L37AE/L43A
MQNETAVIANITDQNYMAHRTYGTFRILGRAESGQGSKPDRDSNNDRDGKSDRDSKTGRPAIAGGGEARADGEAYALTRVTSRTAVMDYGDKRTMPLQITAREIAEDICREINSDAGERSFLGVFVCADSEPTAEEMRGAREKLDEFYRALVAAAEREWERSHSFLFIHDLQRRAAASLGLEKEWYYRSREMAECPGCGERVKPGVAVCKSCGAVLDREKALALGIVQAPAAVGEKSAESFASRQQPRR